MMKLKGKTIDEMYRIAGQYRSAREFKLNDPLTFDAMRKRTDVYDFFGEDPIEIRAQATKASVIEPINPRPKGFLLQFYWQSAQPSARELNEAG